MEKLEDFGALLKELRTEARYRPIHELLYYVYRRSRYYDYVSAMPAGEIRRGNLDMLVEKAAAYEATSYKGLFHFVRYIERLKKYDTDFGEAAVAGEEKNMVRIMSIHKSKGLEFPVVFLAGMGKKFNQRDAYGTLLLDADMGAAADWLDLKLRTKTPRSKTGFKAAPGTGNHGRGAQDSLCSHDPCKRGADHDRNGSQPFK